MTTTIKGLLVPSGGGKPHLVNLDSSSHTELCALIGAALAERVRTVVPDVVLVVDEEGHWGGKPTNTSVTGVLYPGVIVGDALVVGESDHPEGGRDWASLTVEQLAIVCDLLGVNVDEVTA